MHLAALTATSKKDLPQPLDETTCNEPAFVAPKSQKRNTWGYHQKQHENSLYLTPLMLAAYNPNPEIAKALVDAGGGIISIFLDK